MAASWRNEGRGASKRLELGYCRLSATVDAPCSFHTSEACPPRVPYSLSQFAVDGGPAGIGRGYPGARREWAVRASKKSSLAAAWVRAGAMAAMRTYQEKYRSKYFVATPRNGFSQHRKP